MKTILIITSSIDVTVNYIVKKYKNEANFFRVNVDEFPNYRIDVGGVNQWRITYRGVIVEKSSIHSIYYRKPILPDLSKYDVNYHGMIAKDIISLINGIVDSFDGKVLTKPCILRKTENKTFQLLYALNEGIQIPQSYIGNHETQALSYVKDCKSIIKPLTVGKIKKCNEIEIYQTSYIEKLEDNIGLTPVYIQSYEEKQYEVRLTFVNDEVFAVRIDSEDKLDWRKNYDRIKYSAIECPSRIKKTCLKLLNDFDLKFGAFDFIVNKQDEWVFLEINPNGQWLWLENAVNMPISQHIVEYLLD